MDQNKPSAPQKQNAENAAIPSSSILVTRNDIDFIRKALITLGVSIVFSAALVGVSRMILHKLQGTGVQLQAQQEEVRRRFTIAATEKEEIRDYQPKFLQLRARGFFGEEKRLDLIEHIRHIHDNRKLLPLNYEISAQQPFQLEPTTLTPDLELRSSKIVLQMDMLHEMDLFNFLTDLKGKAFFTTQTCTIKRAESNMQLALTPRLAAECTLYLLSVGEHAQDGMSGSGTK
ncbi:MAG: hypothetical protein ACXU8A_09905 [Burkholderiaceae bacterium]